MHLVCCESSRALRLFAKEVQANAVFFLACETVNLFNFVTKFDDYMHIKCSSLWEWYCKLSNIDTRGGGAVHEAGTKVGSMWRVAGGRAAVAALGWWSTSEDIGGGSRCYGVDDVESRNVMIPTWISTEDFLQTYCTFDLNRPYPKTPNNN
jgi:hypothetical protein